MSRPLPPLPYEGVYLYRRETASGPRFITQFRRRGQRGKKTITLKARTESLAYAEAVELGRRFEAGLYDPWTDRLEAVTLAEAVERYLADCQARVDAGRMSALTRRERRLVLEAFVAALPASLEPRDVTADHVIRFTKAPHLKPSTQAGYYSKVRALFSWLQREGYVRESPCRDVEEPRVPRRLPVYLSREEAAALINKAEARVLLRESPPWLPDVIRFAIATGLRLAELCALRWCDVDRAASRIYVRTHVARDGTVRRTKSGHDRAVPIFPAAAEVLERRHEARTNEDDAETVFQGVRGGALYPNYVSAQFRKARKAAGLAGDVHFHTLRHTFASWLVSDGVPLKHVQTWMGHSSMRVTEIYSHLLDDHAHAAAAAAMSGLNGEPERGRGPVSRRRRRRRTSRRPQ